MRGSNVMETRDGIRGWDWRDMAGCAGAEAGGEPRRVERIRT